MNIRPLLGTVAIAVGLSAVGAPSSAQTSLVDARRAGIVGERFDGYLGYVAAAPTGVQRQVAAINIRRRALYVGLATKRGVTPQVAGIATGCELLRGVSVGEVYMLPDRVWRRRQAGQAAPQPDYCG